jgi:hypothetical protein
VAQQPQPYPVHQAAQAAGLGFQPLSECMAALHVALKSLGHHPHQQQLRSDIRAQALATSLDIALYFLGLALPNAPALDNQFHHHHQHQQSQPHHHPGQQSSRTTTSTSQATGLKQQQQQPPLSSFSAAAPAAAVDGGATASLASGPPPDRLRVLLCTGGEGHELDSSVDAAAAAQLQKLWGALGSSAAKQSAVIDVVVGSARGSLLSYLAAATDASQGVLLHQPEYAPPWAANVQALVMRQVGWAGVLDVRLPSCIKLVDIRGPVAAGQPLPAAATTVSPATATAPATAASAAAGGGGGGRSGRQAARWSSNAVSVPAIDRGAFFGVGLELVKEVEAGPVEVEVEVEWTAADGRRRSQVGTAKGAWADR